MSIEAGPDQGPLFIFRTMPAVASSLLAAYWSSNFTVLSFTLAKNFSASPTA